MTDTLVQQRSPWLRGPARDFLDVEQRTEGAGWGWLPMLSLVAATGVFLLALADNASRVADARAGPLYWGGVVLIFAPAAMRIFARGCTRHERLGLALLVGVSFYLLKVMAWPLAFTFHDDLGQLRTTLDIAATHHLFSPNPVVPAYSYYPGTEIATHALSAVAGISPMAAGFVLIGAGRLVLMIALFRLFELASSSSRVAGIAVLFYVANPNFVYFDAQVAYESLALPLVVLVLFGVARRSADMDIVVGHDTREAGPVIALIVCVTGVVVTHHVSAYFLAVALVAWALLGRVPRFSTATPRGSWLLAAASVAATGGWYAFAGPATERELRSVPVGAFSSLWALVAGEAGPKQLFHAQNGAAESQVAQLLGFASVALILIGLPLGIWLLARRRNALSAVLLALALLYPPSLALRLTAAGTEMSSRASEFLFLGVAYVLAVAVSGRPSRAMVARAFGWLRGRGFQFLGPPAFASYASVIFLGGLIVGWPPSARLPAPYQVGQPPRSVGPEGIRTADWAATELQPHSRVIADSTNALLLASYGRQSPTGDFIGAEPLLRLYQSPTVNANDRRMLKSSRYLVVDERLSRALPLNGYFGKYDFNYGLHRPIPLPALRKFDHAAGLDRVYDSGNIAIYRILGT